MKEFLKLFFLCVFIFPAQLIVSEISPHQPITVNQRHAKLETLLFTIEKRLAIMHEIAPYKMESSSSDTRPFKRTGTSRFFI